TEGPAAGEEVGEARHDSRPNIAAKTSITATANSGSPENQFRALSCAIAESPRSMLTPIAVNCRMPTDSSLRRRRGVCGHGRRERRLTRRELVPERHHVGLGRGPGHLGREVRDLRLEPLEEYQGRLLCAYGRLHLCLQVV